MGNLLSANFFRLRRNVTFWGTLAVNAFFGVFLLYTHLRDLARYGDEFTVDEFFFGYTMIFGLVSAVFVSTFLGTEYSDGAIRNKLIVGCSRGDIYLANLITVTAAGFLSCGAFMAAALLASAPFVGFFTLDAKIILAAIFGSLVMCIAYCAVYTLISMTASRKVTASLACVLLFFALLMAATYVNALLDAPPEYPSYELVDGELVSGVVPNPRYLTGTKREVYVFFSEFLPTGQAIKYFILDFVSPLRMVFYSLAITAASTLAGLGLFRRKDLK